MLSTLAVLVFFSAIAVSFSKEIGRIVKKIFTIPGVPLLLPLMLVSFIVVIYEPWIFQFLVSIKVGLHSLIISLTKLFSFQTAALALAEIIVLSSLTLLPTALLSGWRIYKKALPLTYCWLITLLSWIFVTIIFSINLID